MPFKLGQHKYVFIIAAIVIIFSIIIVASMLSISDSNPDFNPDERVVTSDYDGPAPQSISQTMTDADRAELNRSGKVGQLVKKTPYQTQTFSLEYDFSNNSFVYWYKEGRKEEADQELGQFLRDNEIESQDWLTNLVIQSE